MHELYSIWACRSDVLARAAPFSLHLVCEQAYSDVGFGDATGVGFVQVVQTRLEHFLCARDITLVQQLDHVPELQHRLKAILGRSDLLCSLQLYMFFAHRFGYTLKSAFPL